MPHTWIVCYFALGLGLDQRVVNTFHTLEIFETFVFRSFERKLITKFQLMGWQHDPNVRTVVIQYEKDFSPGHRAFRAFYSHTTTEPNILNRTLYFHWFDDNILTRSFCWRPGFKFVRGGLWFLTYNASKKQMLDFIQ